MMNLHEKGRRINSNVISASESVDAKDRDNKKK